MPCGMRAAPASIMRMLVCLPLVAFVARTEAQVITSGPLDCFVTVVRETGLEHANAKNLCRGATGIQPARCYADAMALGILTSYYALQLCAGATSDEPVGCTARLAATSGLVTVDIVQYCAALHWPRVVAPSGGSSACIAAAQGTGLSDTQAIDVCAGSSSTEPATCVAKGRILTGLADADLVDLCTTWVPYPGTY